MVPDVTLLDLVTAVSRYSRTDAEVYSRTDAEVVATVVSLVNGGRVRLCGNFRGARFDLAALRDDAPPRGGRPGARHGPALDPGVRIRSTRAIVHPGGTLRRDAAGTVRSRRVNLGRELVTVDFDSGERLVLFPDEVAPLAPLAA